MAPLDRLLELLRVTQEHKTSCGLTDCEHIGKRHLSRLVNEKDINGLFKLGARPEPCGAGHHLDFVTAQS